MCCVRVCVLLTTVTENRYTVPIKVVLLYDWETLLSKLSKLSKPEESQLSTPTPTGSGALSLRLHTYTKKGGSARYLFYEVECQRRWMIRQSVRAYNTRHA